MAKKFTFDIGKGFVQEDKELRLPRVLWRGL
jgi:hypothetical protein